MARPFSFFGLRDDSGKNRRLRNGYVKDLFFLRYIPRKMGIFEETRPFSLLR